MTVGPATLSPDETEMLRAYAIGVALGDPRSMQVRFSQRLVDLGLLGFGADGQLCPTTRGYEWLEVNKLP